MRRRRRLEERGWDGWGPPRRQGAQHGVLGCYGQEGHLDIVRLGRVMAREDLGEGGGVAGGPRPPVEGEQVPEEGRGATRPGHQPPGEPEGRPEGEVPVGGRLRLEACLEGVGGGHRKEERGPAFLRQLPSDPGWRFVFVSNVPKYLSTMSCWLSTTCLSTCVPTLARMATASPRCRKASR